MVRLEEEKKVTEYEAIKKLALPAKAYIPLSQHLGKICQPLVKPGDSVVTGQKIASVEAHVFSNIHASITGKIAAIQDWPHPVLGRCKTIVIENGGLDSRQPSAVSRQLEEIDGLTPDEIRNIVQEAGIVGMGGASFPTHIKLNPPNPVDTLIINGAECEPYLTSDYRLMVEKTKEIPFGVELVAKCLNVKKVYIAIEDNKPEAIKKFLAICDKRYTISVLKSIYPQGGEKQLIKNVLKKEVPSGKLPFDVGVVVHNVATIYAIYDAAYFGKPLYERVITLAGDCLENPGNFLVRIGTPVKDLLNHCGLIKEPKKVIFGGPMMGISQYSLDTPVIKNTNGIIFFSESQTDTVERALCMRCSRCVQHCPAGLMPCIIAMSSEKEKWDLAKAYNCLDCIECGLCNYVCPQKINLIQLIKLAKTRIVK